MGLYGRIKSESLRFRLMAIVTLLLVACGGGSSSTESTGTSAVAFQITWDRSDSKSGFQRASLTDCLDVYTVSAAVYGEQGELLGAGGPWDCIAGSGVIAGLPSNQNATIAVGGYGIDGLLLYHGQSPTPIFLSPGTVDGGVIAAGTFVPVPLSPASETLVDPHTLEFQWSPVAGAAGYQVTLATSGEVGPEVIVQEIAVTGGSTTRVRPDVTGLLVDITYYWRVQAVDGAGNLSAPSPTWSFNLQTQALDVSYLVFTDSEATVSVPVTTTVAFEAGYINFVQTASVDQWTYPLDPADMTALQDVIRNYDLYTQGNIVLEAGQDPCTGGSDKTIDMGAADESWAHAFTISGQVCDPADWPTGVSELIALKDTLVSKYRELSTAY